MYARLHRGAEPADLAGQPGLAGYYRFEQIGTGAASALSLWHRGSDAGPAGSDLYEVTDDWYGLGAAETPAAAGVVYFDGPLSQARAEAGRRASTDRIRPALAAVPGLVRSVGLWHPDERKAAVVSLASSLEVLETASKAVDSTELLPGEDPALLPGPDRIEVHRVVVAIAPGALSRAPLAPLH